MLYCVYDFYVQSELLLSSLLPATAREGVQADEIVHVRLGDVPDHLREAPVIEGPFILVNKYEIRYDIPGVVKFYIRDGSEILIEPYSGAILKEVLIYFYTNALAAVVFQRGKFPFHVSGVITPDQKVVLFAAPSRTGKSTLAVKLAERGYGMFTDDTAIIEEYQGELRVVPSYPVARLWDDAFEAQNYYQSEDKELLLPLHRKYGFNFRRNYRHEPMPLAAIYFLQAEDSPASVTPMPPSEVFSALGMNIYRSRWVPALDCFREQFMLLSKISSSVPCFCANRQKHRESRDSFAGLISEHIQQVICVEDQPITLG